MGENCFAKESGNILCWFHTVLKNGIPFTLVYKRNRDITFFLLMLVVRNDISKDFIGVMMIYIRFYVILELKKI